MWACDSVPPRTPQHLRGFSLLFLALLACGSSLSLPLPLALPTTRCGRATAGFGPQASLARAQTEPDPDVHRLSDGSFYNERLRASNVWEMALPSDLVDEAADLFYGGRVALSEMVQGQHEPYSDMATAAGTFFCQKVTSWNSDLLWVSVDDRAAFAKFEQLFQRMRLPEHFASVVPHRAVLRLQLTNQFHTLIRWSHRVVDEKPTTGRGAELDDRRTHRHVNGQHALQLVKCPHLVSHDFLLCGQSLLDTSERQQAERDPSQRE